MACAMNLCQSRCTGTSGLELADRAGSTRLRVRVCRRCHADFSPKPNAGVPAPAVDLRVLAWTRMFALQEIQQTTGLATSSAHPKTSSLT